MHLQAPPNLSDDFGVLLDAGIDDWGGVSPVTADHVNPERPWPALDRLRDGHRGARPHPGPAPHRLPRVRPRPGAVARRGRPLPRCSTGPTREGLARDDPGADLPGADLRRHRCRQRRRRRADRSPQHRLVLRRRRRPALLVPDPRPAPTAERSREVLDGVLRGRGGRRRRDRHAASAPAVPRSPRWPRSPTSCAVDAVGDAVTFVHNRNINYTNVCTFKCRFCGFSKGPLSLNLRGTPYLLDPRRHRRARVVEAVELRRHRGLPAGRASTPTSTATTTSTSPGR